MSGVVFGRAIAADNTTWHYDQILSWKEVRLKKMWEINLV